MADPYVVSRQTVVAFVFDRVWLSRSLTVKPSLEEEMKKFVRFFSFYIQLSKSLLLSHSIVVPWLLAVPGLTA